MDDLFDFNPKNRFGFNTKGMTGGLSTLFGGLFGDSGAPYDKAMEQYEKYGQMAANTQQPYLNAGTGAIPEYQEWLRGQKDPSKFINDLMSRYQASPYNQYLQQQAMRAGQNFGSANGLTGSTPLLQQMQQNSSNIASGGLNDWLQQVLGINTQYGQGQQNLMTGGQTAANALTNLYNQMGENMATAAAGKESGSGFDFGNIIGGLGSILGSFL